MRGHSADTPASFSYSCANLGVNNVMLTVSDAAGNTATCTAVVTVQDHDTSGCPV
jgi:hypothetical protein